jgi:hypothetical protein
MVDDDMVDDDMVDDDMVDDDTEYDDTEDDDTEDDILEQEFYKIENSGEKDLRVTQIAGGKPWNSLPWKESATLDDWKFNIGDLVYVRCTGKPDGLAKVSEIRQLGPELTLVVTAWCYTRDGIEQELPEERQAHLDRYWPRGASFSYMLSSNRTITIWNAIRGKASPEVMAKLCPDKFYVTTNSFRKIYKAGNPNYKWMKKLLHLKTKEGVDPRSDDCLIPGADAMLDIQPSATPEPSTPDNIQNSAPRSSPPLPLTDNMSDIQPSAMPEPSTPHNIQNSAPCASPPLPLREELLPLEGVDPQSDDCLIPDADAMLDIQPSATPEPSTPHNIHNSAACASPPLLLREEILANADGESPTVSTTLDQNTMESSCVASPIATEEAPSRYIEDFNHLYEIGFFSKSIILFGLQTTY